MHEISKKDDPRLFDQQRKVGLRVRDTCLGETGRKTVRIVICKRFYPTSVKGPPANQLPKQGP